ncbi:MAG TPA: sigma-70 family RNA polymerase sigma factor [Pirellulaceae bacterium]|nr:sigma-70 family RNA polymerase sigma factor [Pirellulaceae bacterium]
MTESDRYETFVRLFAQHHRQLYAYILAFEHDRAAADEVFQETSLILWREFAQFRTGAPFLPWATAISFNQLRKFWRQRKRDRRMLSDPLLDQLALDAEALAEELDDRRLALADCLRKLPPRDRQLIDLYYGGKSTAGTVAEQMGRSVHTVYKSLQRVRGQLMDCIQQHTTATT